MKSPFLTITLLCLLLLTGCIINHNKTSLEAFNREIYTPEYASGFKILGAEDFASTLIQISNPWQGAKDVKMSYFVSRNGEQAPAGFNGPVIPAGAKRIVCMSSSYIAMLDALGESNGFAQVIHLQLSIPYLYIGEYLEESPLGKAEWMIVLSELIDNREKGLNIFREIPRRYHALKALTDSVEKRPTVMFNTPWNDSWVMPSTQSYMAQLVADAGADYIYKENDSNSSTPIGLETAYGLIQKADYWINVGSAKTLDELKAVNPKFADAKAVHEKTVYNNNLRLTPTGGNDYWESSVVRPDVVLRDLIRIFHPKLVSDSLYYYRNLE